VPPRRRDEAEHGDKRQHGSEQRRRGTAHRHCAQRRRRLGAGQENHLPGHFGCRRSIT
jgi:hypothetical protein